MPRWRGCKAKRGGWRHRSTFDAWVGRLASLKTVTKRNDAGELPSRALRLFAFATMMVSIMMVMPTASPVSVLLFLLAGPIVFGSVVLRFGHVRVEVPSLVEDAADLALFLPQTFVVDRVFRPTHRPSRSQDHTDHLRLLPFRFLRRSHCRWWLRVHQARHVNCTHVLTLPHVSQGCSRARTNLPGSPTSHVERKQCASFALNILSDANEDLRRPRTRVCEPEPEICDVGFGSCSAVDPREFDETSVSSSPSVFVRVNRVGRCIETVPPVRWNVCTGCVGNEMDTVYSTILGVQECACGCHLPHHWPTRKV